MVNTRVQTQHDLANGQHSDQFQLAADDLRGRLGNHFFQLNRVQFQQLVAMYLDGNDWLTGTESLSVEDNDGHRQLLVHGHPRARGSSVVPISWRTTPRDDSRRRALQELARQDADFNPRWDSGVNRLRVQQVQADLAAAAQSDFTTDVDQFQLVPSGTHPLTVPVVRTYNGRVLNFNAAMVAAVRAQHDGAMPRYAQVLVHATEAQLAIRFSPSAMSGGHLVSPASEYNSYRVHAGSAVLQVQRRLREDPDKFGHTLEELRELASRVNGRRRCHQVGDLWVVDYTSDQL